MCMGVLTACSPVSHVHAMPMEARRGHRILWNGCYRQLLSATWVLGTESGGSSGKTASVLNPQAMSPVPVFWVMMLVTATKGKQNTLLFNDWYLCRKEVVDIDTFTREEFYAKGRAGPPRQATLWITCQTDFCSQAFPSGFKETNPDRGLPEQDILKCSVYSCLVLCLLQRPSSMLDFPVPVSAWSETIY